MSAPSFTNRRTGQYFNALMAFLPFVSNAKDELMIGILHPGGGQYDCLSLMNSERPVLQINLLGTAHVDGQTHFNMLDFWERINPENAELVGELLFVQGSLEIGEEQTFREPQLALLRDLAYQFAAHPDNSVELHWGWFDSSSEGSASNFHEFPKHFPLVWRDVPPVANSFYDWAANILQVSVNGSIIATYNQRTCEKLDQENKLTRFTSEDL